MPKKILQNRKSILVTLLIIIIGCGTINLFSPSDDYALGLQLDEQIRANPKEYPILKNEKATSYLQDIVNTLIYAPEIKYRGVFAYKVSIINNDEVINAFCTPGGFIYVYTGLLKFVDNEATLAGVLAHEIAHAELRHSTQRMTKAVGLDILSSLVLGSNPSESARIAANLFTGLALLKNSRDDEYQSDEYSFKYLYSTKKWYPGAIKYFFQKTMDNPDFLGLRTLISTHPLGPDRVEAINKMLKQYQVPPPTEDNLQFRRYKEFLTLLK